MAINSRHAWWASAAAAALTLALWLVPLGAWRSAMRVARGAEDAAAPAADTPDEEAKRAVRLSRDAEGRPVLEVTSEAQERLGLAVQAVQPCRASRVVRAFGALEEDPATSFTLRAPMAGYLAVESSAGWPALGARVAAGRKLGAIRPRLSTVERYDIAARLMQAKGEVEEIRADLAADRASYESKSQLNKEQKVVTDRALEEAEAKLKRDDARLKVALDTVRLLEGAVSHGASEIDLLELTSPVDGVVVSVTASPGEAVESGQALLRTANYSRLIARVGLAYGDYLAAPPDSCWIEVIGATDEPIRGNVLATIGTMQMMAQGQTFLIDVDAREKAIRPGMAVRVTLSAAGDERDGVVVPRRAVIRLGGSAWVYAATGEGRYTRVEVALERPVEGGWCVSESLEKGSRLVVTGAGTLLSEELRSQIEAESEGEE